MNKIYTILGPSGSGKSTLVDYAKENINISEIISHSTRGMRDGECEGNPYYFVSEEEFENIDFIEEVEYAGNKYGISYNEVESKLNGDNDLVVIVDAEGIKQLIELYDERVEIVYIYSTVKECYNRMNKSRGHDQAMKRLANAVLDEEFDNHDIADYIIRNKDLDKAKKQIVDILGGV